MPVNVVTLGVGGALEAAICLPAAGFAANHASPFLSGCVQDFGAAYRAPLTRESVAAMSVDFRIDMTRGDDRVFSPKSSLLFAPLRSVRGFSPLHGPAECVEACRRAFLEDADRCFRLLESDEPAVVLMCCAEPAQAVYGRVARPVLSLSQRAKRAFCLMSTLESGGLRRRAHGFYTMPFPRAAMPPLGPGAASVAALYVRQALERLGQPVF